MLSVIHRSPQPDRAVLSSLSNTDQSFLAATAKTVCSGSPYQKEKVELCRQYMETGYCPYGERCKFAHGLQELMRNHHPNHKYKTKECEHFRRNMACMYGPRCNFIHRREELPEKGHQQRTDIEMGVIRGQARGGSRLLAILQ